MIGGQHAELRMVQPGEHLQADRRPVRETHHRLVAQLQHRPGQRLLQFRRRNLPGRHRGLFGLLVDGPVNAGAIGLLHDDTARRLAIGGQEIGLQALIAQQQQSGPGTGIAGGQVGEVVQARVRAAGLQQDHRIGLRGGHDPDQGFTRVARRIQHRGTQSGGGRRNHTRPALIGADQQQTQRCVHRQIT